MVTANSNMPKREQAIVLHPLNGLLLKGYIIHVLYIYIHIIIPPSNIIFVSKHSTGRICFYMLSYHLISIVKKFGMIIKKFLEIIISIMKKFSITIISIMKKFGRCNNHFDNDKVNTIIFKFN